MLRKTQAIAINIDGDLENKFIKDRYIIGRHLDSGNNGKIYKIIDERDPRLLLVMKISENYMAFAKEISFTKKISKASDGATPIIDYGLIK